MHLGKEASFCDDVTAPITSDNEDDASGGVATSHGTTRSSSSSKPCANNKKDPEARQAEDDTMIFEMFATRLSADSLKFLMGIDKVVDWHKEHGHDDDDDDDDSDTDDSDTDDSDTDASSNNEDTLPATTTTTASPRPLSSRPPQSSKKQEMDTVSAPVSSTPIPQAVVPPPLAVAAPKAADAEEAAAAAAAADAEEEEEEAAVPPQPPRRSSSSPSASLSSSSQVAAPQPPRRSTSSSTSSALLSSRLKMKKHVKFETNHNGVVQRTVIKITKIPVECKTDCWWTGAEKQAMVKHFVGIVDRHQTKEVDYTVALTSLYKSTSLKSREKDESFKALSQHDDARGLEHFIVQVPHLLRRQHLERVLRAQEVEKLRQMTMYSTSNSCSESLENIRRASIRASLPCRQNALRLAEYDTRQALDAMASDWGSNNGNKSSGSGRNASRRGHSWSLAVGKGLRSRLGGSSFSNKDGQDVGHGKRVLLERSDSLKDMTTATSADSSRSTNNISRSSSSPSVSSLLSSPRRAIQKKRIP